LAGQLSELGVSAQVYGSHGWQVITGLDYIHPRSDLDLLLPVTDLQQADAVADVLSNCPLHAPRLDGELMFPNGSATAWREWCLWRRGAATDLLVKSLNHVHLERDTRWLNRPNQLPCA
jgi:phosphoribosyl-dephospho-CoA transferase